MLYQSVRARVYNISFNDTLQSYPLSFDLTIAKAIFALILVRPCQLLHDYSTVAPFTQNMITAIAVERHEQILDENNIKITFPIALRM